MEFDKYKDYLMNQSIMHKHSVLNQLQTEIKNVVYNIDMEETGGKFLAKIYEDSNYYFQYQEGQTETFAKLDPERLHNLLAQDWAGEGNFSSKIWKNKDNRFQIFYHHIKNIINKKERNKKIE